MSKTGPSQRDNLAGESALIIGGAGAIGHATARTLLKSGAYVTLLDKSATNLDAARSRLIDEYGFAPPAISCCTGDATDEAAIYTALLAAEKLGPVSIGISIVGGAPSGISQAPLIEMNRDDFIATVNYNLDPAFLLIKQAAAIMKSRQRGSIVVVSSVASIMSAPLMGGYGIGKAALDMLVRASADELGAFGIRVNAVRPGITITESNRKSFEHPAYIEAYMDQQALKRTGQPEDIAALIGFLSGPDAQWITGQCMNVDGGLSLHRIPKKKPNEGPYFLPEKWSKFLG